MTYFNLRKKLLVRLKHEIIDYLISGRRIENVIRMNQPTSFIPHSQHLSPHTRLS